uniref:Uncharacterized protein n=1 Tax=Oryza brachyantha TaxID=4533 RepID=J3NCW7_ORYBR
MTEQMSRIVNELDSIHLSIKKASQMVKEIGRQIMQPQILGGDAVAKDSHRAIGEHTNGPHLRLEVMCSLQIMMVLNADEIGIKGEGVK